MDKKNILNRKAIATETLFYIALGVIAMFIILAIFSPALKNGVQFIIDTISKASDLLRVK
jgi:hypothetical protein